MPNLTKTLFVCTGNVFRSVVMEKLFQRKASDRKSNFTTRSRGINLYFENPNPVLSEIVEDKYSINIGDHKAKELTIEDIRWASSVICFTEEHKKKITKMHPSAKSKVFLVNEIADLDPNLFTDIDYYNVSKDNKALFNTLEALKTTSNILLDDLPSMSVVMAVYNEEKNIKNILTKLIEQSKRHNVEEIVVVSSGSDDKTNQIIKSIKSQLLVTLKEEERNGKVSALKKAAPLANGDNVLLIDGDVDIEENFIEQCFVSIQQDEIPCTGKVIPVKKSSRFFHEFAKVNCAAWNNLRSKLNKTSKFLYPSGYTMLMRKDNFDDTIKELDSNTINDDGRLAETLFQKGVVFYYREKLRVFVTFPQTFQDFFKQKVRTRMGRRQVTSQLFKDTEKKWRRELVDIVYEKGNVFALAYLLMDAIVRFVASVKIRLISDPHLWESPETTKQARSN